ncbi:MAG: hypothetical protein KF764_08480 [Labilithrix sp.]|nr:hypothetical protein [Labilithrix sp.]
MQREVVPLRRCSWCSELLSPTARPYQDFCGRRCRQSAFRLRRRRTTAAANDRPMRFAYADPPYPGRARKYYANEPSYAGEVDHAELIASLEASGFDGWALSTAADALRDVLPLCPAHVRVTSWVKPIGASSRTYGIHNTWEPLLVVGGRKLRGGVRDWLSAQPARFGGALPGRKPLAFCAWLFDLLGMLPGDELVDLFPGSGVVSRAWSNLSLRSSATLSPAPGADGVGDASARARGDASARARGDASARARGDASPRARGDASARARGDASPRGSGDAPSRRSSTRTTRPLDTRLRERNGRLVAECRYCKCPEGCACSPEDPCACGTSRTSGRAADDAASPSTTPARGLPEAAGATRGPPTRRGGDADGAAGERPERDAPSRARRRTPSQGMVPPPGSPPRARGREVVAASNADVRGDGRDGRDGRERPASPGGPS